MPEETNKQTKEMPKTSATAQNTLDAAEIARNAVLTERKRIMALDALVTGNAVIDAYIKVAKQNDTAAEEAAKYVEEMKNAVSNKATTEEVAKTSVVSNELLKVIQDNYSSGAGEVQASTPPATEEEKKNAARKASAEMIARFVNEGGVR